MVKDPRIPGCGPGSEISGDGPQNFVTKYCGWCKVPGGCSHEVPLLGRKLFALCVEKLTSSFNGTQTLPSRSRP